MYSEDEIGNWPTFNTMVDTRLKSPTRGRNRKQASAIQHSRPARRRVGRFRRQTQGARQGFEGALGNICDALNLMLENVGELIANAKSASDRWPPRLRTSPTWRNSWKRVNSVRPRNFATSEGVRDLNRQAQTVLQNCQSATKAAENGRKAAEQGSQGRARSHHGHGKIRENTQANTKKIKRLGDRSMEIAGIVKVIGDISAKTDMLALNASIEAARIGEQGRGFTVVAEQVPRSG